MDNTDIKCFKHSELPSADLQIKDGFSLSPPCSVTAVLYFIQSEVRL